MAGAANKTNPNAFMFPRSQYVPLADVSFAPYEPVMPAALPPSSMVFPTTWSNDMSNIPGQDVFTLYNGPNARNQYSNKGR